ncbi:MAG: NAD-binding protein [Myxococcales bacterium]|nr:NAD-binding protein [Myxococcales bacterium]
MNEPSLRERLAYRFDNFMSRGPGALVFALLAASLTIVLIGAALIWVTGVAPEAEGGERPGFVTLVWMSAMRAMDAGTVGGDDGSKLYLFFWFLVTIGGILVVSAFIGVLTSGLDSKLADLRRGRSRVIERNHVLILGWSPHLPTIVRELAIDAESEGGRTIVVLADRDKVEMDETIATKVPRLLGSRVVCRSGNPIDLDDLEIGSPQHAEAVVVLGSEGSIDPDAGVIKAVLALVAHKPKASGKYHIVAEIRDPKNRTPCRMVGKDQVEIVVASEVIARIAVQTSRQSGLSAIYQDLLDFDGDEIYFREEPSLVGRTLGDCLAAYEDATVIGIAKAGRALVNPPMTTAIEAGDRLIVIAEDDSKITLASTAAPVDASAIVSGDAAPRGPERTLILGWNARGAHIIRELDHYGAKGSEITVVASDEAARAAVAAFEGKLQNHAVRFVSGDTTDRTLLDSLEVARFQHVLTLAYADRLGAEEADALTLVTLLHLRDIEEKHGESFSIVSEMLDSRNQKLAEITKADDFIVSDNLISLLLAQVAGNKALAEVFEDLFDADGSEVYLKDAAGYVQPSRPVSFATLIAAAKRRNEIAIGYISGAGPDRTVKLNPRPADQVTLAADDRLVVIAES